MTAFALTLSVDNAAFEDGEEAARILWAVGDLVRDGGAFGRIRDINGNRVGYWTFKEES